MAPPVSALGIVPTVHIEHICSDPFALSGAGDAAIPDSADCLQHTVRRAVASTRVALLGQLDGPGLHQ